MTISVTHAQSPLNIGLKAGYSSSKLTTDSEQFNDGSINNFLVGIYARVNINKFYIQPEGYFASKGGKLSTISGSQSFDMSTIDVPVLLGVKLVELPKFNFRVNAGPVFSFVTKVDDKQFESIDSNDFKDNYVGIQYGAGVDFLFLSLDARMENSFGNIQDGGTDKVNSNLFLVTLGIKFL